MIPLATLVVLSLAASPLLQQIESLNRSLAVTEKHLQQKEEERQKLDRELVELEIKSAQAEIRRREVFAQFSKRITALAKMPDAARLMLLGAHESLSNFLATKRTLRWIAQHDLKLNRRYQEHREHLENLQKSIALKQDRLEELRAQIIAQRETLALERRKRSALLQQRLDESSLEAVVAGESKNSRKELAAMVDRTAPTQIQYAALSKYKGKLPWPTAGKVQRRFGQEVEREHGTVVSHNGLDIDAPHGSVVQSVGPGKVAFAGWLQGYGQVVIVDHGQRYHSVVAHLSKVNARKGQTVSEGSQLGLVGDSGSQKGSRLYFELRRDGRAIDPMPWLR